jgi:hypothetical protein
MWISWVWLCISCVFVTDKNKTGLDCSRPVAFLRNFKIGRCERIRTFDPLHPMQVRYQAAPHTEAYNYSVRSGANLSRCS